MCFCLARVIVIGTRDYLKPLTICGCIAWFWDLVRNLKDRFCYDWAQILKGSHLSGLLFLC